MNALMISSTKYETSSSVISLLIDSGANVNLKDKMEIPL